MELCRYYSDGYYINWFFYLSLELLFHVQLLDGKMLALIAFIDDNQVSVAVIDLPRIHGRLTVQTEWLASNQDVDLDTSFVVIVVGNGYSRVARHSAFEHCPVPPRAGR